MATADVECLAPMASGDAAAAAALAPGRPAPAPRRFERNVEAVLGVPFDACRLVDAVATLRRAALSNTRCLVSTPNVNFVVAARSEPDFLDSILRSDLSLADGMPIVWTARLLGVPITERVAGANLFEALLACPGPPLSVYFFGGPPGAAAAAQSRMNAASSGLRCVGFDEAGYGSVEALSAPETIERINASGAHFVVVALGARKGQAWLVRNAGALTAPLLCHLGAVVNFAAGKTARAPRALQQLGLEWLWRVKEEPALWRRYLRDGVALAGLILTRVLPGALSMLALPRRPARLTIERGAGSRAVLRLSGTWTRTTLEPLRGALEAVATPGTQVVVCMRDVSGVDSAFVGLLLLAAGAIGRDNVRIENASRRVRLTLRGHLAEYFVRPSSSRESTDR